MHIDRNTSIKMLQDQFQAKYPALKIAFFKEKHAIQQGTPKQLAYDSDLKLGELIALSNEGDIELKSTDTVAKIESAFKEKFNLNVQVYRRSNDLWLQTINTDNLTLEEQNSRGLESIV